MKALTRCALLILVVLAADARPLLAEQWTCYAIQPGDTTAAAAIRMTGSAHNRHQPWFQIFDPAGSRFVAKARYDHIRPGWRACVLSELLTNAPRDVASPTGVTARLTAPFSRILQTFARILLDPLWVVALLLLAMAFAGYAADHYLKDRQRVVDVMKQFGEAFVREFERPLIESRTPEPALRSRLRFRPHQLQVEVLLAPAGARSYPNLFDHRKNVAYDTERVLHVLRDRSFVSGPPHQHGQWVVIPFRFRVREKQEGAS